MTAAQSKWRPREISVTHASRGLRVPTETAADDAANAARKQVVLENGSRWSWSWNDPITLPSRMMLNFGKMLDERGMTAPHVTPELLQEAMAKLRRDIGGDVAEMLGAKAAERPKAAESLSEEGFHLYWWSKGLDKSRKGRIVPQCFTLPACTVYDARRMWFMPYSDPSITPHTLPMLRICDHFHLPFKQQPRWCEWHAFMKELMTGLHGEIREKIIRLDRRSVLPLAELETSWGMVKHVADTYRRDMAGVEKANYARIQISTVLKNRARMRAASKRGRND